MNRLHTPQPWRCFVNMGVRGRLLLTEFGRRHGLTLRQAFSYLLRYKGIGFVEPHYDYLHTQSFATAVDDLTQYCHKLGGGIA